MSIMAVSMTVSVSDESRVIVSIAVVAWSVTDHFVDFSVARVTMVMTVVMSVTASVSLKRNGRFYLSFVRKLM